VLDEEALYHRWVPQYDLPTPVDCLFLERGDADIYQVHTIGPTFYLKIYRPPHPVEQAEAEARLVMALLGHGADVVAAVPRRDGRFAAEITASEGPRAALLFEEAPPLRFDAGNEEACRSLGAAVAKLHTAADAIPGGAVQVFPPEDLLHFAERLAYEQDYEELLDLQQKLRERLDGYLDVAQSQDVGWCHTDLVLSNIRCREDGSIVFFDFGNAGWSSRADELVRVRRSIRQAVPPEAFERLWAALVEGYGRVRTVPAIAENLEPSVVIETLRRIGWIGGVMASCPLRMGTETFNREWVRNQLRDVRASAAEVLRSAGPTGTSDPGEETP
jgi:Ser/Thr protein kinase RdoA (MazF antagonist)